jgi:teichuronic acid biosynthesis glycosyltransferase TuaC
VKPLRLLTFTTLYPHAGAPNQGVFVENRLRHLVETGLAHSTVLAPVPWFPTRSPRFGSWSRSVLAPLKEERHGITVLHPRYAVIPKVGMSVAPALLYASAARALSRLMAGGARFDLIDAHYLYPDGVAAVMLARRFNLPVVMTARGSDVTQLPDYALPRRMIRWAMARADGMVSVSAGLKRAMTGLGADANRITVLRNGVDLEGFRPLEDRDAVRAQLRLSSPTLLSVGNLVERKRHHLAIEAMTHLPEWRLLVVGDGPERSRLAALTAKLGLEDRVSLVGAHPHAALRRFYGAADMLILASSREGWANVLLESMACGSPVVASDIPGNDEVVQTRAAGLIAGRNTAEGFADAVRSLWADPPGRDQVRAYAENFSWKATSIGQMDVFAAASKRFAAATN